MSAIDRAYRERAREVAASIRFWRGMRGLSQVQLADKAGFSRGRIVRWETHQALPTLQGLWALADALDVPVEDLLCRDPRYKTLKLAPDDAKRRRGRPRSADVDDIAKRTQKALREFLDRAPTP